MTDLSASSPPLRTQSGQRPRSGRPRSPLSATERAEVSQVARRLHEELRAVVGLLPADAADSASAMARILDVNRATCQRVLNTIRRPGDSADVLLGVPGVSGLSSFIAGVGALTQKADAIASAAAAVEEFRDVIARLGGTHAKLCRRLRTPKRGHPTAVGPSQSDEVDLGAPRESDLEERRWLFHAATRIVGRYSEVFFAIQVFCPITNRSGLIESATAIGAIGHRARAHALPLVFKQGRSVKSRYVTLDRRTLKEAGSPLLEDFCSQSRPRPTVIQCGAGQTDAWHVFDGHTVDPVDLVVANRSAPDEDYVHPARRQPPIEEAWMMMTIPARHVLQDVYLHRDLARMSVQTLDVHLWGPNLQETATRRWTTRLPGGPVLQLLGIGTARAEAPVCPRHGELTRYLFDQLEWNADEFVGYRCYEHYPIWRAGYRIAMDFTGSSVPEGES